MIVIIIFAVRLFPRVYLLSLCTAHKLLLVKHAKINMDLRIYQNQTRQGMKNDSHKRSNDRTYHIAIYHR